VDALTIPDEFPFTPLFWRSVQQTWIPNEWNRDFATVN
jgi:hypothetical protein